MNRTGWAALLLVTTTALAGCSGSSEATETPPPTAPAITAAAQTPASWPVRLAMAGFQPPAAGSLGADTEWVEALRKRVLKHAAETHPTWDPPAAEDITVVSAGDAGEMRYAELFYPTYRPDKDVTVWVRAWFTGESEAAGSEMRAWMSSSTHDEPDLSPDAVFFTYRNGSPGGVAVVSAPGAKAVTLAGGGDVPRLESDGGSGWAAEVGKAELKEPAYLIDGVESVDNVSGFWPHKD